MLRTTAKPRTSRIIARALNLHFSRIIARALRNRGNRSSGRFFYAFRRHTRLSGETDTDFVENIKGNCDQQVHDFIQHRKEEVTRLVLQGLRP